MLDINDIQLVNVSPKVISDNYILGEKQPILCIMLLFVSCFLSSCSWS